jgi:uncharacterized protein (TIGR03435 family)
MARLNRIVVWVVLGFGSVSVIQAQSSAAVPAKFEVAAVRPCRADREMKGDGSGSSPERLHLPCMSVDALIWRAYENFAKDRFNAFASYSPMEGAPKWIDAERFQIDAKARVRKAPER